VNGLDGAMPAAKSASSASVLAKDENAALRQARQAGAQKICTKMEFDRSQKLI
jgi:hypothetical protein